MKFNFETFYRTWKSFELDGEEILRIDPGEGGFWELGEFWGVNNPWENSDSYLTPFDTEFYLILNVAVGGTNGFFPDDAVNGGGAAKEIFAKFISNFQTIFLKLKKALE